MGNQPRRPTFLIMIGVMTLILGVLAVLAGLRGERNSPELKRLNAMSFGGELRATGNFEAAVNRYVELEQPLAVLGENSPDQVALYLKQNAPAFSYLDKAVTARRICFRRHWERGFQLERLGVIDMHNLARLNWFRMNATTDSTEIKRLAASIRTLANYLEFDPVRSSVEVFAPVSHIYLFALEESLNRCEYSPEELEKQLASLEADDQLYSRVFAEALRTERILLQAVPETLNAYAENPGTDVKKLDFELTFDKLSRMALLLEEDYSHNAAELDAWQVPDAPDRRMAGKLVPPREYALRLAGLHNHNRAARTAIAALLGRDDKPLADALTGKPLQLTVDDREIIAKTADAADAAEYFRIERRNNQEKQ